jgi:hypothetical protein
MLNPNKVNRKHTTLLGIGQLIRLYIALEMSSRCILLVARKQTFSARRSITAAFVPKWDGIQKTGHGHRPLIESLQSSFSSVRASSSLYATIPSISESLDFGDLDYRNGIKQTHDGSENHGTNKYSLNGEVKPEDGFIRHGDLNCAAVLANTNGVKEDVDLHKAKEDTFDEFDEMSGPELKALCKERGLKVSGTKAELQKRLREHRSELGAVLDSKPVVEPISTSQQSPHEADNIVTANIEHIQQNPSDISSTPKTIEIKSQPKPDGNWKPDSPLEWCKSFGSRSVSYTARLESLTHLQPGDEGYFDVTDIKPANVTVVRTKEQARKVMEVLMKSKVQDPEKIHACDTEVMDIDLKEVGPVGHGYVTCLSVYSGEDFDYGLGDGPGTMLWIDNLDDAKGILYEFREWLEDEGILKVWHNYGFDRHVLFNEGINVLGFGGDTMHMARLSDTSRLKYSLESLTEDLLRQRKIPMKEIFGVPRLRKDGSPGAIIDLPPIEVMQRDPQFRENWIKYSAFDAKSTYNLYENLRVKLMKTEWIQEKNMMDYYKMHMRPFGELLTDLERRGMLVAKDYLADIETQARKDREGHAETFRQWAYKQIGPDGLAMNTASSVQLSTFLFGGSANAKTDEVSEKVRVFKTPRAEIPDDAMEAYRERDALLKKQKANGVFVDGAEPSNESDPDEFDQMKAEDLKALCKEYGLKVSGKKLELQQRLRGHFELMKSPSDAYIDNYDSMSDEDLQNACAARGLSVDAKRKALIKAIREDDCMVRELAAQYSDNKDSSVRDRNISEMLEKVAAAEGNDVLKSIMAGIKAKNEEEPKFVDVTITSLGMKPEKFTVSGAPSATADVLKKLAGDPFANPPKYGSAYDFFGGGERGHEACVAFFSLTAIGSIDTMIANFLTSLQTLADEQNRV